MTSHAAHGENASPFCGNNLRCVYISHSAEELNGVEPLLIPTGTLIPDGYE
jgi:hypothetical protein